MTDTTSRPAPQQACPECKGAGGWASTARGRGVGGQMMTMCEACNGTGTAPQQEQAVRFSVFDGLTAAQQRIAELEHQLAVRSVS